MAYLTDPSSIPPSLLLLGLVLAYYVGRVIHLILINPLSSLPGPQISKWTSVALTYHYFFGQRAAYIHRLHEKYGPVVRISPDEISFHDLSAAREIHKVGGRYVKSEWYQRLVVSKTPNIFSTSDPVYHAKVRRLLSNAISDVSLQQFEPIILERVHLYISRIQEEIKTRGAADLFKWSTFYATDIIGELAFGESFRMLERGENNQYTADLQLVATLQPWRTTFPFLLTLSRYVSLPKFREVAGFEVRVRTYATESITRYKNMLAENPTNPKPTLFTKMFNAGENGLTDQEILANSQAYIIAGSDTTALTLTYLLYSVCRENAIQEKLVAELQALPDNFSDDDTRHATYLNQVINETLRLYSAAPASLPRVVPPEGAELTGYNIPPGTIVSTQAYTFHRDPAIFPNPERFDPSRWESPTTQMRAAFMPFGAGSRICIGMHLARMEIRLAAAHFFRKFPHARVSSREGMSESDMVPNVWFLMSPKGHRCLLEA